MRVSRPLRFLCCGAGLAACLPAAQALNVRVLIAQAPQVTIRVNPGSASSTAPAAPANPVSTSSVPASSAASSWTVGVSGAGQVTGLTLNGQPAGNATLYLPPAPGSRVDIAGKSYRGGVLLRAQAGAVQAINVVEVDDYVRGVVASEMPASWPAGALAAQAIIARTYVAARINPAQPYDTCATESCQVYGGVAAEKPSTDAAVRSTAGQVVAFGGKAATTYFSSDSGGYTASAAEVWNMKGLPYLPAQADPFSLGGPRGQWDLSVPQAQVQVIASRYGARVGPLASVVVSKMSESGRPQEITFTGTGGTFKLQGAEAGGFIRALGAGSSRATLRGINPLVVSGTGQGHGVGLSQYGALGMAKKGYDHLHILGFYYPGTVLSALAAAPQKPGPRLAGGERLPTWHQAAPLLTPLVSNSMVSTSLVCPSAPSETDLLADRHAPLAGVVQ
ncbi:SpoIID/LytB domain-containing protein [Deinococcus fonticola]|uniref:SpoIID/LytB domain-containing protein n=1 Tax=Deinococcus fonticola TaxID=2528713 RepID=UPI001075377E|nr:SpoIID/LytB domain-containing protein [Deinococcus fonticola]